MSKSPNASAAGGAGNPKKVTQVFAGIAALTFAAGGGLVFWLNGQIRAGQAAAANKEAQVGSSEEVAKRLDATQATYDAMTSRVAFLEASVTEKSYVPTLLQQLQTLAAATHLTVMSVQPAPLASQAPARAGQAARQRRQCRAAAPKKAAAPPPYDTMGVNLSVTGTYADTVTFLYDLTQFPKILSVEGAQFSPGAAAAGRPGEGAAPQVTTQLKLTAFVFHDDAAKAPAAPANPRLPRGAPGTAWTPPTAPPTVAGAAGRAAQGAVAATKAANGRSQGAVSTL